MAANIDLSILDDTRISQREFAELVGVSRVTVSNWCRGAQNPSKLIGKLARKQLAYLTVAHRMGSLPGNIPKMHKSNVDSRMEYIRDKLADAAQKIREAKESEDVSDTD